MISLRVADSAGNHLGTIAQFGRLEYVMAVRQVGALTLDMPRSFDVTDIPLDARITVWHSDSDGVRMEPGCWLVRKWQRRANRITALHANHLIARRMVGYYSGSIQNKKSGGAATILHEFVSQNLGISVQPDRDGGLAAATRYTPWLAINAPTFAGPTINKSAERGTNLLSVLNDICDAATESGSYLAWDISAPTDTTLEWTAYAGQRGVDRRESSAQPVVLSDLAGTLENTELTIDRTEEITSMVIGGAGEGQFRAIGAYRDDTQIAESVFGWIEKFKDFTTESNTNYLILEAYGELRERRPRVTITGQLVDRPLARYGVHYGYGDYVTAEVLGQRADVRLDTVHVTSEAGRTTRNIKIETRL